MDVLILGAGVRPAAFSALRIGLKPTCGDLFGDTDLVAACPSTQVDGANYPLGLLAVADKLTPRPWFYTGALENRPELVDAISSRHRLIGHPGSVLRAIRDPVALSRSIRQAGMVAPEVRLDPRGLPTDGSWLRKPIASAGGRGIRPWFGGTPTTRSPACYQERVEGLAMASIHVGSRLMGVTRQLVGHDARPFAYRGSIAPWPVSPEVRDRIEHLGRSIATSFGLEGVFGVDLILKDGIPWPVEVNPRYSASVEALEWATGRSILAEHFRGFGIDLEPVGRVGPGFVGKAILFASVPCRWPEKISPSAPDRLPDVADIPSPNTRFRAGEPVATVFALGETAEACEAALEAKLNDWRSRLRPEC